MSAPMVKALLVDRKTQTRRAVKANRYCTLDHAVPQIDHKGRPYLLCNLVNDVGVEWLYCPYGSVGDHLWVREAMFSDALGFAMYAADGTGVKSPTYDGRYDPVLSRADWPWRGTKRRTAPAIFMPRAYSRITLEITDVRVERVQDIATTQERQSDIIEEGAWPREWTRVDGNDRRAYAKLWDSINGKKYPWSSNPWVWVVSFGQVRA